MTAVLTPPRCLKSAPPHRLKLAPPPPPPAVEQPHGDDGQPLIPLHVVASRMQIYGEIHPVFRDPFNRVEMLERVISFGCAPPCGRVYRLPTVSIGRRRYVTFEACSEFLALLAWVVPHPDRTPGQCNCPRCMGLYAPALIVVNEPDPAEVIGPEAGGYVAFWRWQAQRLREAEQAASVPKEQSDANPVT